MDVREFVPVKARPIVKWLAIGDLDVFAFYGDGTAMRSLYTLDHLLDMVASGRAVEAYMNSSSAVHRAAQQKAARERQAPSQAADMTADEAAISDFNAPR